MAIIAHDDWGLSSKGAKDASRHREKIEDSIKKNIKDIIAEESIITQKHGKTVRVPVKGLRDYRFVYGNGSGGGGRGGVGQGEGKAGDIIRRQHKKGQGGPGGGKGKGAGNQPGEDYMETEVDIDYLINIMFEDLGLPYIEDKDKAELLVPAGWKFETVSKVGIQPRVHKNRTIKESIKRMAIYAAEIMEDVGCDEETAYKALAMVNGDLDEALKIAKEKRVDPNADVDVLFIEDDDMRYKQIEQEYELHSNAVVIAMMDTSGSMTPEKKYLARSLLFWMNEFLKKSYNNVVIRFIAHTTDAHLVDEDTFFRKGESGGTLCHTAFDIAEELIENEYPVDFWNVYVVYVSDGEDFEPNETMKSVKRVLDKKINMLGYCEIDPDGLRYGMSDGNLLSYFKKMFKFKVHTEAGANFFKDDGKKVLACSIKGKEHVYPALKHMLFQKKEEKK